MTKQITIQDAKQHYHHRLREFAAERPDPGGIVLVGSSHLEWFDTDRFLPQWRFINRGIASDTLGIGERGILHRLDVSVFDLQPAYIVFNNAVNDIGDCWRAGAPALEVIRAAYTEVVGAIRRGTPKTPMLIVNELPTRGRFAGLNEWIPEFNLFIAQVARANGCFHLDFHRQVADERGELRAQLTTDGLHLNEAGYARFAERLRPFLPPV